MNKFILILSLAFVLLFACKKETSLPESIKITEYQPRYMLYPLTTLYKKENLVKIEYNTNGTISKRVGDFIATAGAYRMFYDKIYDDVVTKNDIVTTTKQLSSNEDFNTTTPLKRELYFKGGRLVKKIWDNKSTKDTTTYHYNDQGQIDNMVIRNLYFSQKTDAKLVYDEGGNLILVTSQQYYTEDQSLTYSDTTRFSNYDQSKNPFTNLIIFDECFYRSLSRNNFAKYSYRKYNSTGRLNGSEDRSWEFTYDANNNLLYSNF
jgi:hypothetical protein